jgi:large subunit ribosomal protein L2
VGRAEGYAQIKLGSGEVRLVPEGCMATVGAVSNPDNFNVVIGKAGRNRHLGIRPSVRGVAMNPVDHPHGGGEGKTSGGRHPVTPWGKKTRGPKTRKNKSTDRLIVRPTLAEVCIERAVATGQPDLIPIIDAMAARYDPLGEDEPRYDPTF